jgi:hypothetical protein
MTTQTPHPPPQPAYPTAPPWASPVTEQAAPAGAEPPPYIQTGQLLVPYPEEMQNAARPTPPSWWPVIPWTFFFGILGLASAARRANRARRGGNSPAPYWIAWAATLAVVTALWGAGQLVVRPMITDWFEQKWTVRVEQQMRTDGEMQKLMGVKASTVNCEPVGDRDAAGIRNYDCTLGLEDGRTGALAVTADSAGNWTAVPPAKKRKK